MEPAKSHSSHDGAREARRKALMIAAGFFLGSSVYIAASSGFLGEVFTDPVQIAMWEIGKGMAYVSLSTGFLYYFIKRGLMSVAAMRVQAGDRMLRLSLALDNIADAFYAIDKSEKFLFVNKSAAAFYKKEPHEMVGEDIWPYFAPHNVPILRRIIDMALSTGVVQREHMGRDERWMQVIVYPHGEECLIFFQDVTQAWQAERNLAMKVREQSALAKFSMTAFQSQDAPEVVEAAVELVCMTLAIDVVMVSEVVGARDQLSVVAAAGLPEDAQRDFKFSAAPASSLVAKLVRDMQPAHFNTPNADSYAMAATAPESMSLRSGVGAAAYASDGTIILLYGFAGETRGYTDGEGQFLQTMANMIAALRDRRLAAETLRLRDRALESITQGISVAVVGSGNAPTAYINRAFSQMTGYTPSEIFNKGINDIFTKRLSAAVLADVTKAFEAKQPIFLEMEVQRKDGSTFIDHISSSPILNAAGEVTHYVAVHEDYTQKRRDEALLERKTAAQKALADFTVEALGSKDFDKLMGRAAALACNVLNAECGTILDINLADDTIQILGVEGWELGGDSIFNFSDWPQDGLIPYSLRTGEAVRFSDIRKETRFKSDLTTDRLGVVSGMVVMVMGWENIRGFLSVLSREVREFTDDDESFLKTLANVVGMLKERERDLARIYLRDRALEAISQGIGITDETLVHPALVYANPALARMTGYSLEELRGFPTRRFLPPNPPPGLAERLAHARARRREVRFDTPARRKDGSIFLDHVTASPIINAEGDLTHFVSIHEDITEARQRDQRMHESQRMEAIGQLTGGIAHDFNNLLTVVRANAEDMRDQLKGSPLLHRQADMVLQAATRGADLVQQLMAYARKQELEPKAVDVNAMLASFTKLVYRALPENVVTEVIVVPDLPAVKVDPSRLETALLNLVLNARDAMPDGGKIMIETQMVELDNVFAGDNPEVAPGRYVQIAVSDTGVGMSKDVVKKAFQPFFTTKDVGQGSGLGLSMVYGFARQSGGYARIYSEEGQGTTVKIFLPPTDGAVLVRAAPDDGAAPASAKVSGKILLVEDDDLVRESVEAKLTRLGYDVTSVVSADAAVRELERYAGYDLVFTDVIMPGTMTGADLARLVPRRWPVIKVLMTSGYTEASALGKINMPEGVRLLSKPYSNAELAEAFRDVLSPKG